MEGASSDNGLFTQLTGPSFSTLAAQGDASGFLIKRGEFGKEGGGENRSSGKSRVRKTPHLLSLLNICLRFGV